jgi:hypothetical protein
MARVQTSPEQWPLITARPIPNYGEDNLMSARWSRATYSLSGGTFIVLAFSVGGGALINTWLSMVHASLCWRLVATIPWISLALLAMLRMRRAKREGSDASLGHAQPSSVISNTGWAMVLLVAGSAIGVLVAAGNMMLLGIFATAYGFAPWRRMPLCRQHPAWAVLSMCGGGAVALSLYRDAIHLMALPVAAWILGMSGLAAFIGTTRRKTPSKRPGKLDALPVRP